jgi:DmsE family decaheme c-type cytochrome
MKHFFYLLLLFCLIVAFPVPQSGAREVAEFVGSEVCLTCHEEQGRNMMKNPHWKKAVKLAPINARGCESCHGPGGVHAEKGGGKGVGGLIAFSKNESPEKRSNTCLRCHENGASLALWDFGVHKQKDVVCSECHSVHRKAKGVAGYGTGKAPLGYFPDREYQTCGKCHLEVKAQVNRRSRHPIVEGRVTCSNCHNPHGSMAPSNIKAASVNQLCFKCHADKRGPFMWEHPPVEETCSACHTPHGSNHLRLLTEKIPNLCQACHDTTRHPGTRYSAETLFRGQRISGSPASPVNRSFARSCLNCHSNIHGSNAPSNPSSGYNSGHYLVR